MQAYPQLTPLTPMSNLTPLPMQGSGGFVPQMQPQMQASPMGPMQSQLQMQQLQQLQQQQLQQQLQQQQYQQQMLMQQQLQQQQLQQQQQQQMLMLQQQQRMATPMMVPQTGMMVQQTGMMPQMTGMMMPQTGMMQMGSGMMMPTMMTGMGPMMMPQPLPQQQQMTFVEEKKKAAEPKKQEEEESPFDKEKEDIKVAGRSHTKVPFMSVRRLTITVNELGKLDITQLEADFVSIDVAKRGEVRIHHLKCRRLEVAVSGKAYCKIGGPGGASSSAIEQKIHVADRGVFDGRLCRGKDVVKQVSGRGQALVADKDGVRILRK